jgi:magnesium transporter
MNHQTSAAPWQRLRQLTRSSDANAAQSLLATLEPVEAVRALFRLSPEDQRHLLEMISPDQAADLLEDLPDAQAVELIEHLDVEHAADIVEELASDQGADLLGSLEEDDAQAILAEMVPEIASEVRDLIGYSTDVAGGLMESEHYAYPQSAPVGDFLDELRRKGKRGDQLPQRLILVDEHQRPVGGVEIASILLTGRETRLADLSQPVRSVAADASLEELENYFDRYETQGAPVVDANGALVGRVRLQALLSTFAERGQRDQLKVQGIVGGEELRGMPLFTRARRRLSWLSLNIFLNILSASVIALFQDTLSALIALAVVLPIVSDMSGCSGNQAVAVSMRELTLGIVQPRDVLRVWWQEASVGLLNGLALGALLFLATYLWQGNGTLGLVVGVALGINTVVAVSIGGTVPLLLKWLHTDPAVASGPVLTTVTDMCGFLLVLGLATIALPWLT